MAGCAGDLLAQINLRQRHLFVPPASLDRSLERSREGRLLARVQRLLSIEYPWLTDVQESMLVTDCRLPDCPIVYANDSFEVRLPYHALPLSCPCLCSPSGGVEQKMTLYPKEEIVGRNCRFLQGPLTNRNTVSRVRQAVDNGEQLEVEILNYRKDGLPFWNNFLMLPVHKNPRDRSSRVVYFIAIQKDISVIKFTNTRPDRWNAAEVAIWFQHNDWEQYAPSIIEHSVDGEKLMHMTDAELLELGVMTRKKRAEILAVLDELRQDPATFNARFNAPEHGAEILVVDDPDGINHHPSMTEPKQLKIWNKASSADRTCACGVHRALVRALVCVAHVRACSGAVVLGQIGEWQSSAITRLTDRPPC